MNACKGRFKAQRDSSFALFVQSWPGDFCSDSCCQLNNEPNAPAKLPPGFTIHGYWPNWKEHENQGNKNWPECCQADVDGTPATGAMVRKMVEADDSLEADVATYWPAMKSGGFLEYEFDKHGTCALHVYTGSTGPHDYVEATINMRKKWDFLAVLLQNGIVPDQQQLYARHDVINAIEAVTHTDIILNCGGSSLREVVVCISHESKDLLSPDPMDCPASMISENRSKCPEYLKIAPLPTNLFGAPPAAWADILSNNAPEDHDEVHNVDDEEDDGYDSN